jgi:hypothetical protein
MRNFNEFIELEVLNEDEEIQYLEVFFQGYLGTGSAMSDDPTDIDIVQVIDITDDNNHIKLSLKQLKPEVVEHIHEIAYEAMLVAEERNRELAFYHDIDA